MDQQTVFLLGEIVVKITGPLLFAIVIFIYASVYFRTGKFPSPPEALFVYARLNIARRHHVGILIYCFIACMVVFIAAVGILLYAKFII